MAGYDGPMTDRVQPGDPHWGAYVQLQQEVNTIDCIPTWDEIREMEYIRQRGDINMLSGRLKNILNDEGYYHALCWYLRCRERKSHWFIFYEQTIRMFEDEHGPRHTWFTEEDRINYEERSLELEEQRIQEQLRQVRKARQNVRVKKGPTRA